MVTGNLELTSNSVHVRPIIEDALSKILNGIGCENVYTAEMPPVVTELEFAERLQIHKSLSQPEYEGWFINRTSVRVDNTLISNQFQYNQVHGIMITGIAYHGTFHDSYRYIQDKSDELMWTLEKNKDMLGGEVIQYQNGLTSGFSFNQVGEMYFYQTSINFEINRVITETSGRSFSS